MLDLDRHRAEQDGIAAIRALGFVPTDLSPVSVTTPSGGLHLYFQHRNGLTCSARHLPDGVDIRAEGGYVIAPGTLLPDGCRYGTANTLDKLPPFPPALAPPVRAKSDPHDLSDLLAPSPDWDTVRGALSAIPPDVDYCDWFNIGMALHSACGGLPEGLDVWDAWSKGGTKYKGPRELASKWRSFTAWGGIGLGTLFHLASAYGWSDRPEWGADDFEDLQPLASRLKLLTPADCKSAPSRGYIIKGMLAPRDVGCIFGQPGAGKSLLAPHLAYAVAQGREAFGLRTRQGGAFYVAAEDAHGMLGRVRALEMAHNDAPQFKVVDGVCDLLADGSPDLADLVNLVREHRPALIVIDTLAMAFPGLEENDAKGMGRVVAVARKLTQWGAAVLLIHHDTKAEGATPRGHSLLNGALDMALWVKRDEEGIIRGRLTKNRNGTCDRDIAFRIETEDGGQDDDGDAVTWPRCGELVGPPARKEKALPRGAQAALHILRDMEQPVTEATWRQACIDGRRMSPSEDRKSRITAFRRAVGELIQRGSIRFENGFYWEDDGFDPIAARQGDRQRQSGDMSPNVATGTGETGDRQRHTP